MKSKPIEADEELEEILPLVAVGMVIDTGLAVDINSLKPRLLAWKDKAVGAAEYKLALAVSQGLGTAIADYGELTPPNPKDIIKAVIEVLDRDFLTSNEAKDD